MFALILYFKINKQLSEKDGECQNSIERAKTDYEKKISRIQKEIDRFDEYKSKVTDLEIKIKSMKPSFLFVCSENLFLKSPIFFCYSF